MSMLQLWTTTSVGSSWTPQIPTGLTATIIDDTHIDISWVNIAKEGDGTKLERSTDGITFSALFTNAAGVAIYHDTVTVGVVYFYRIYAYKGTVNSGYSSIYTVQTTHTVLADVFTGSTIDGSKWTETDPDNIISQNGQLILLSTSSNSTQLRNNIKSIASISNGIAVMQGKVTWSADSGVNYSGIYLYKDVQ